MKVKLIKTLRIEQITLRLLLLIGVLAFMFSVFLEIGVKEFVCQFIYERFHIDYVINIMLGISASSMISFISLIFPYMGRKNKQIEYIISLLNQIYEHYLEIYVNISQEHIKGDYSFEKHLLEKIDELERMIKTARIEYEKAEFTSATIVEINQVLKKKMLRNLSVIRVFCSFILLFEEVEKEKISDNDNLGLHVSKDIIMKRAEKDLYKCLLEMMDSNFTIKELVGVYQFILEPDNTYKYLDNKFKDIQNAYEEMAILQLDLGLRLKIQDEIIEIRRKHETLYEEECQVIKDRLKKTIQNLKVKGDKEKKYNSMIEKIFEAIRIDDLKEAEKLLVELECEAERKL